MRPHQLKIEVHKDPQSSPCVRNCCLDDNDICLGCFRSLDEITSWTEVNEQTRQDFLTNANNRKQDYQQK
jgi:predicted Fe-S protein YdhL (DUF1289 family)